MQGAYGGLIIIICYGGGTPAMEDNFLLLEGPHFMLLSGENLILL